MNKFVTQEEMDEKVGYLEGILGRFIAQTERSINRLERNIEKMSAELKEDQRKMKEDTLALKKALEKDRKESEQFRKESEQARKNMNKQWGNLANRLGTLIEDIVIHAVRPASRKHFGEKDLNALFARVNKHSKKDKLRGEFDVFCVTDKRVYLVETKSYPDKEKLMVLKDKKIPNFRKLFPEYNGLELIPIFASLHFDEKFIQLANEEKVYLLAYREWDYMDILNFEAVSGK
ncbi:MAG: hypothetical protein AAF960_27215 [Bacteroidota bacterium]